MDIRTFIANMALAIVSIAIGGAVVFYALLDFTPVHPFVFVTAIVLVFCGCFVGVGTILADSIKGQPEDHEQEGVPPIEVEQLRRIFDRKEG